MKRKKKRIFGVLLCMVLLLTAVLSGCGKRITAESLMEEVNANTKNLKSISADMKLEMGMALKTSGMSMELDVTGDFEMETTSEPNASHTKGTISMSLMGLSMDMESYMAEENGKAVTYTNSMGEWIKTETEIPDDSQINSIESIFDSKSGFILNDKTEKVHGKEDYVLTSKISGDMMNALMGSMSESMDDMSGELDWSKFNADITLKVDKDTKMPVEIFMDCSKGMSEFFESAASDSDEEMQINNYTLTITFTGFNDVEKIVVPEEAKTAEETDDTENGLEDFLGGEEETDEDVTGYGTEEGPEANADGTYPLYDYYGVGRVNIGVPEGYEISPFSDENYLLFTDTADELFDDVYITYMLSSAYTEDELVSYYMDTVAYYNEDEDYSEIEVQDVTKVQTDSGEAGYIKVAYIYDEDSYCVEYYAYMFFDDHLALQCSIEENAYQQPCGLVDEASIIENVFSVVSVQ